jgi:hypothetical protein
MIDKQETKYLKVTDKECELLQLAVINYMSKINFKGGHPYAKHYDQLAKLDFDLGKKWASFAE